MLNLLHHTHFGQADDDSSAGNAHPLWQQSDFLSALPTSPIRIEEILALRSGLPTNETGFLAAGSGCGNAHIPAPPPSRPPKPPVSGVVVCDPAVFFLSHFIDPTLVQSSGSTIKDAKNKYLLNKTNDQLGILRTMDALTLLVVPGRKEIKPGIN